MFEDTEQLLQKPKDNLISDVVLYNYQKKSVDFILDNLQYMHVLLAASPNAGKTFMSAEVLKILVDKGKRILCSVHGTNVLKMQFYKSIISQIDIRFVSVYDISNKSLFDPSKPIQIMIYQNEKQIKQCVDLYGKFDHLLVDEAHKFYNSPSLIRIGEEYVSGNHLLLTGSPSIFRKDVKASKIAATYIAVSTIHEEEPNQYDSNIITELVTNDIILGLDDFNVDGEVLESSEYKLDESNNNALLDTLLVDDFGKNIIYVKTIKQSININNYLVGKGFSVLMSNSENDTSSENVDRFKELEGEHIIIVVGRCKEGYDDPNVSIIDLTYTKNVNSLSQMHSRAVRMPTRICCKRYIKVVPNDIQSADMFTQIMTAVLMLMEQENFENYNGKNFSLPTVRQAVKIGGDGKVKTYLPKAEIITDDIHSTVMTKACSEPRTIEDLSNDTDFKVTIIHGDKKYVINKDEFKEWEYKLDGETYYIKVEKSKVNIDDDLLIQTSLKSGIFFDVTDEQYGLIHSHARSKLSTVLADICGTLVEYATAEEHAKFIKENKITGNDKYAKQYKNSKLNLHSCPWVKYGNGSAKDYFASVLGAKEEYATAEEHIKFIKENEICISEYPKQYKNNKLNLHSNPWVKYGNGSAKDYFASIWGAKEEYATAEEHIQFIRDNKIFGSDNYIKQYKNSKLNLVSIPWRKYGNGNTKDYFASIWGAKEEYATAEEHIQFIRDNKIFGSTEYAKQYKNNKLNLHSNPWVKYGNGSAKDYFASILGAKEEYATAEEHIQFIMDNKISGSTEYAKQYKNSKLNLHSSPWKKYGNGKKKDYFASILGTKEEKKQREYREQKLGEFSKMNQRWSTYSSKNLHTKLCDDSSEWTEYHKLYSILRETWSEIPADVIASKITDESLIVADLGCGEKLLSNALPKNKVLNFDHVPYDDTVVACDVSNLPLGDNTVDVAVISLSLMGSNDDDYIRTAYRILKNGGILYIAEPFTKGERNLAPLLNTCQEMGFSIKYVDSRPNTIYIDLDKK